MRTEQIEGLEARIAALEAGGGSGNVLKYEADVRAQLSTITSGAVDLITPEPGEILIPLSISLVVYDATPANIGNLGGSIHFHYTDITDDLAQHIATIDCSAFTPNVNKTVHAAINETRWSDGKYPKGRPIRMSAGANLVGGGKWKLIIGYLKIIE